MCVFCDMFGNPEIEGGLWYLNPVNYGRQLYRRRRPGTGFGQYGRGYRGASVTEDPFEVRNDKPERIPELVEKWWANLEKPDQHR